MWAPPSTTTSPGTITLLRNLSGNASVSVKDSREASVASRKTGHVFAFEPDPTNFSLLKKNVESNGYRNVTLIPKAISDVTGSATLYLSDCSALHRLHPTRSCHDEIRVDTIQLDDYFQDQRCRISLIKLDIEGAEPLALGGMSALLERNPSMRIFMEFVPRWLREAGFQPDDLVDFLKIQGFDLYQVDDGKEVVEPVEQETLRSCLSSRESLGTNLWCVREDYRSSSEWRFC